MVHSEHEGTVVFRSVPARRRWRSLNRKNPLRWNGRYRQIVAAGGRIDEATTRQHRTGLDHVQLIVMVDQFVVVIVVFVIAVVAIGADGREEMVCGRCYRALVAMIVCHVRELKVDVVQSVMWWRRRTTVWIAFVGVQILVLASDKIEVIVASRRSLVLHGVDLLAVEDLRLRHIGSTLQQRARRTVERMLAGLHL